MSAHIINPGQTNKASKNKDHIATLLIVWPILLPNIARVI